MKVDGKINDIMTIGSNTLYIVLWPEYEGNISRHFQIYLSFHAPWIERIVMLNKDDKISIIGKIDTINSISLKLENCEIKD